MDRLTERLHKGTHFLYTTDGNNVNPSVSTEVYVEAILKTAEVRTTSRLQDRDETVSQWTDSLNDHTRELIFYTPLTAAMSVHLCLRKCMLRQEISIHLCLRKCMLRQEISIHLCLRKCMLRQQCQFTCVYGSVC